MSCTFGKGILKYVALKATTQKLQFLTHEKEVIIKWLLWSKYCNCLECIEKNAVVK